MCTWIPCRSFGHTGSDSEITCCLLQGPESATRSRRSPGCLLSRGDGQKYITRSTLRVSQTQAQSTPLQACCPHPSASDSTVCLSTWVSLQSGALVPRGAAGTWRTEVVSLLFRPQPRDMQEPCPVDGGICRPGKRLRTPDPCW
ncbi:Olfactory receptor 14K1 [Manis javanica]|nr:Olfactory receptor 14K1 [Manis javanica]KAI5929854.1 Olfactory receptor 14K1 [Manis javanica]